MKRGNGTQAWEPQLVGFLCNWCSYAGADMAGVSRFQYPHNLRVIRVMCSGRVDPRFVLSALSVGMDGVLVLGCHPGDCHYMTGNYYAVERMKALRLLLELTGLNPDRVRLDWVSAAEGERFARIVKEFTERIRELGPLGESEGLSPEKVSHELAAAYEVFAGETVRWLVGIRKDMVEKGNVFNEKLDAQQMDALISAAILREYLRSKILLSVAETPASVRQIAQAVERPAQELLPHVAVLERLGLLNFVGTEERSPLYQRATH